MWRLAHCTFGQITVSDHQINIIRQAVNCHVGDGDIFQSGIIHFFTQHARTHCAGTHTSITGNDNFTYMRQIRSCARSRCSLAFRFSFHVLHTTGCFFQVILVFGFAGFQQHTRHNKGDGESNDDCCDVGKVSPFWSHRQNCQDGTWRRRRYQTTVQQRQREYAAHTAQNHRQDQAWIHQHIREVNFVNTAQEVDNSGTTSRLFSATTTKEHVSNQNTHTRAWVGFNQEEDRFTNIAGLLDTQRREDTVVNRIVQEQNFCWFNKDRGQW